MHYPEDLPTVRMYHPGLKEEIDVPAGSQGHHYLGGWVLVTEEHAAEPDAPAPSMTRDEVEAHKAGQDKATAGGRRAGQSASKNESGSE